MAQRSHVPKFGNWEGEENVPYTAYFDKARKGRSGNKMINPNDPEENPDVLSDHASPTRYPASKAKPEEESMGRVAAKQMEERPKSREDGELKFFGDSPAHQDNVNRRAAAGGRGVSSGEAHKRNARASAGSENSFERSPLHPQARFTGKGGGFSSPSREGRVSHENSHGTPGRSRLRPKGDHSPDKGAAVPKFGEWDESNPASADGYTHIFNKVREERNFGGKVPGMPNESPYSNTRRPLQSDGVKSCCFPWGRK